MINPVLKKILLQTASILIFIVLFAPLAFSLETSAEVFQKDVPVNVTADSLDYDSEYQTYHAAGNAEASQGATVLRADEMFFDMARNIGVARGHISGADEGGNELSGESLSMNLKKETVIIFKARIFFKRENVYLSGDVIQKTGEETYEADRMKYTPCDCPEGQRPAWSFYASGAKVERGEFMTGRHTFFQIKDVPVLYTPVFSAPIKDERETGFLTPKPGFSKLRGYVLENEFFWDIAKNQDATFALDVETARGLGKGVDYRYIRKRRSFGELEVYQYEEKDINRVREFRKNRNNLARPETATNNRWQLKYNHTENMLNGFVIKSDVNVVSDDEYFIDFGQNVKDRSLESIESNVSVSKSWAAYSLVTQFRYFDNLLVKDKSAILHKIPEINFRGADQQAGPTPFYYSFDSSLINFNRDTGVRGQRLDLHPRLSLPLNAYGYFDLTPFFAPRATFYEVKSDPHGRYNERYIYDTGATMATTFVRVFDVQAGSLDAVKHTIRPGLAYTYIPEMIQEDQPMFDSVDHLPATNAVTYSLNNTLTGKFLHNGNKQYLDFLYMNISQTYNINEATRHVPYGTQKFPFSDVAGELILKPTASVMLTGKESYNTYDRTPTSYDASIDISGSEGNHFALSERFIRFKTRYVQAFASYRVVRPITVTLTERYSDDLKKSLETVYGLEYRPQCWSVTATYTVRPEEKSVFFIFNLMGLGKVAALQSSLK